ERVGHRLGGLVLRQHRAAAGVERRGVLVVHPVEAIRVTRDDGRDHGTVLHAPYRSQLRHDPVRNAQSDIRTTYLHARSSEPDRREGRRPTGPDGAGPPRAARTAAWASAWASWGWPSASPCR